MSKNVDEKSLTTNVKYCKIIFVEVIKNKKKNITKLDTDRRNL